MLIALPVNVFYCYLSGTSGTCVKLIMSADNKIEPLMVPSADFFVAYTLSGAFLISICIYFTFRLSICMKFYNNTFCFAVL